MLIVIVSLICVRSKSTSVQCSCLVAEKITIFCSNKLTNIFLQCEASWALLESQAKHDLKTIKISLRNLYQNNDGIWKIDISLMNVTANDPSSAQPCINHSVVDLLPFLIILEFSFNFQKICNFLKISSIDFSWILHDFAEFL